MSISKQLSNLVVALLRQLVAIHISLAGKAQKLTNTGRPAKLIRCQGEKERYAGTCLNTTDRHTNQSTEH